MKIEIDGLVCFLKVSCYSNFDAGEIGGYEREKVGSKINVNMADDPSSHVIIANI